MESRISGFQVPTVSRLILDFSCSDERRSRCAEVTVSDFILMVSQSTIRFGFGERKRGWQSTTTRRTLKIRPCTTTANSVKKARGSSQGVESTPTTFLPTGDHATSASRQVKLAWVSWRTLTCAGFCYPIRS